MCKGGSGQRGQPSGDVLQAGLELESWRWGGAACAGIAKAAAPRTRQAIVGFQLGRIVGYATLGGVAAATVQGLGWLGTNTVVLRPLWTAFHVLALLLGLLLRGSYTPQPGWWRFAFQVLLATALLSALLGLAAHHLPWVAMRQEAWLRIAWMLGILVCSALLYFGVLWATGLRLKAFLKR